jgi:hypothetical protein
MATIPGSRLGPLIVAGAAERWTELKDFEKTSISEIRFPQQRAADQRVAVLP